MKTINLEPTPDGYKRMRQMFTAEREVARARRDMAESIANAIDGGGAYDFTYRLDPRGTRDLDPDMLRAAMEALVEKETARIGKFDEAIAELAGH